MNPGVTEEVGQTARSVVDVMRESPLSLALVLMNCLLIAYLFYNNARILEQRAETTRLIITWQQETNKLMANCIGPDVSKMMIDDMQRTTETILNAEQTEIQRLQKAIDEERAAYRQLQQSKETAK